MSEPAHRSVRTFLAGRFALGTIETVRKLGSHDTTQKFLFRLADGQLIETVLIPASPALYGEVSDRRTLCISTQVGCAYGCKFCASGLDGWKRNLRAGEIVEQILRVEEAAGESRQQPRVHGDGRAARQLRAAPACRRYHQRSVGRRPRREAHHRLHERIGPANPVVGRPVLCKSGWRSPCTGRPTRSAQRIMPVNRKYPSRRADGRLPVLPFARKKQKLTFEYILIDGVNDTEEQAQALCPDGPATSKPRSTSFLTTRLRASGGPGPPSHGNRRFKRPCARVASAPHSGARRDTTSTPRAVNSDARRWRSCRRRHDFRRQTPAQLMLHWYLRACSRIRKGTSTRR